MGRLGPLNSLAFGRSPFQPPELDDNGDFILGSHAHVLENKNSYVQLFDARGHPKNDASKATIRGMQHAQNAVLETVGVVVRRDEASKSAWQRQGKKRKLEDIINENSNGIVMREIGPLLMQSSMWWAISLRRRMQTFRSYLQPPVLHIVSTELKSMGLLSILTDGLLPAIASYVFNIMLMAMQSRRLEVTFEMTLHSTAYSWKPFASFTAGLIVPLIVFPAKSFAVLQSLHLIPSTFHLSPWSFMPFTATSPVQIPEVLDGRSNGTGIAFATSLCYNAFIVSTISDLTKSYVHNAMYRVLLLTLTPRPDHPDKLTTKAARRDQDDHDNLLLPGIGPENNAERLSQSRSNDFWTEIRRELALLAARMKWLQYLAPWLNPARETTKHGAPEASAASMEDAQVRARSEALQIQRVREDLDNLRDNEAERLHVQRQAHAWALAEFGNLYDIGAYDDRFLLPVHEIFGSNSTATPDPVDFSGEAGTQTDDLQNPPLLFNPFSSHSILDREEREGEGRIMASMAYDIGRTSSPSGEAVVEEASHLAPEDTHRRRASILPDDSQALEDYYDEGIGMPEERLSLPLEAQEVAAQLQNGVPEAPESPLYRNATPPAISRNRTEYTIPFQTPPSSTSYSSDRDSVSSTEIARRRRRARTRTDPLLHHSPPEDLRSRYESLSSDDGEVHNTSPALRHRVTMLSLFPAEMFAECLAGLITSAITLPLDTLYVRSLVHGFLGSPGLRPGASDAALGIRGDVYAMNDWLGGSAAGWNGRLRYAGLMALMMGLQGCVSSLSWTLVTKLAILFGKQSGWGQL